MTGAVAYYSGLSAEESVARNYEDRGHRVRERRWRGQGGEIDLILDSDDGLVFVEVKKSRSFARAAAHLSPRQVARICAAATEYVAGEPDQLDTGMRFDLALVDGHGAMEVVENILS